jgi:hypothetical protein
MKSSSFSVGISDLIANKTTQNEITRVIETQKQEVQLLIEKVHLGIFENKTANSNAAEFELQVNNLLNKALEDAGKIGRNSLGKDNRFVMIVNSGSKGGPQNISQMISCFGQQNIDGKRIPNGFDNRPLPHFCKYDDSPKARGFIENSYITGLTAVEVFYHAMGGRIGLIDTAVKSVTWETPIIIIENQKKFPLHATVGKDNLGNKFTGVQRTNFSSSLDNLLFLNDGLSVSYTANLHDDHLIKNLEAFSSGISIPFKSNTFSYDFSRSEFKGTNAGSYTSLVTNGFSQQNRLSLDRVLLNKADLRISINGSLTSKSAASYQNGAKLSNSERRLTILNLGFS